VTSALRPPCSQTARCCLRRPPNFGTPAGDECGPRNPVRPGSGRGGQRIHRHLQFYRRRVFFANENERIRKVSPAGVITTIAGIGTAGFSGDGGPATRAQLSGPTGLSVDRTGNIYFVDIGNNVVRVLRPGPKPVWIGAVVDAATERPDPIPGQDRGDLWDRPRYVGRWHDGHVRWHRRDDPLHVRGPKSRQLFPTRSPARRRK
jgi:hypothetical protein